MDAAPSKADLPLLREEADVRVDATRSEADVAVDVLSGLAAEEPRRTGPAGG